MAKQGDFRQLDADLAGARSTCFAVIKDGKLVHEPDVFVTAIGAGTTYPDYKPAPFIVSSEIDGVDMVTVVTEGIFSYCGVKVKIDVPATRGNDVPAKFSLSSMDKCVLGQFAANIRRVRPPEPYKGKGIRYADEHIQRKMGKAFASGGA